MFMGGGGGGRTDNFYVNVTINALLGSGVIKRYIQLAVICNSGEEISSSSINKPKTFGQLLGLHQR